MEHIDTVVIGGGVIGLASALEVSRKGYSVCVIEREPHPGMGTSTHNSQVIHAGLYYPKESLKTKHCIAGASLLYEFCKRHEIPHVRCGKLIVASTEAEVPALELLHKRGIANGVRGLDLVDSKFIQQREPHVKAFAGLYSPNSGILEAETLVRTLARLCMANDTILLTGTPLLGANIRKDSIELQTSAELISTRSVVNAAGLWADKVSKYLGGEDFTIYPCRGEYAELVPSRHEYINALVYPLPHTHGHSLGVHFSKTTSGTVTVGPTAKFQSSKNDYEKNRIALEMFLEPAQRLLPKLKIDDLKIGNTGIRAKLHPPEQTFADFLIGRDAKCPRLIQAAGIESPGLTACLSIGKQIAELVESTF